MGKQRIALIESLIELVMDRFRSGFSMDDSIEGVRSGRDHDEDIWKIVRRRCEQKAIARDY